MSIQSFQNFYNDLSQFCQNPYPITVEPVPNQPILEIDPNTRCTISEFALERYITRYQNPYNSYLYNYSSVQKVANEFKPPCIPLKSFFKRVEPIDQNEPQAPLRYQEVTLRQNVNPSVTTLMETPTKRRIALTVNCLHWSTFVALKILSILFQGAIYLLSDIPASTLRWSTKMVISIVSAPVATAYIGFKTYEFVDENNRNERMKHVSDLIKAYLPSMRIFKGLTLFSSVAIVTLVAMGVLSLPTNAVLLITAVALATLGTMLFNPKINISKPQITPRQICNNSLDQPRIFQIFKYRDEQARINMQALNRNLLNLGMLIYVAPNIRMEEQGQNLILNFDAINHEQRRVSFPSEMQRFLRDISAANLLWDMPQQPIESLP